MDFDTYFNSGYLTEMLALSAVQDPKNMAMFIDQVKKTGAQLVFGNNKDKVKVVAEPTATDTDISAFVKFASSLTAHYNPAEVTKFKGIKVSPLA